MVPKLHLVNGVFDIEPSSGSIDGVDHEIYFFIKNIKVRIIFDCDFITWKTTLQNLSWSRILINPFLSKQFSNLEKFFSIIRSCFALETNLKATTMSWFFIFFKGVDKENQLFSYFYASKNKYELKTWDFCKHHKVKLGIFLLDSGHKYIQTLCKFPHTYLSSSLQSHNESFNG